MLHAIWESVWLLLGMALTLAMEWAVAPSTMSRMAQCYDLDLGWLWWLFSLDLDRTPSTVFRNNKWQIYTKGLLVWTVTDTVAYALLDYCNLKHTNLILDVSLVTILLLYLADHDAMASANRHTCSAWRKGGNRSVKRQSLSELLSTDPIDWQWATHPRLIFLRSQCFIRAATMSWG